MAEQPGTDADLEQLKTAIRETVASGRDLQARVQQLTVASLQRMGVQQSRIQQVIRTALEGVEAGISPQDSGAAARRALAGIEDALLQVAEASSLAIREAAGRASGFARNDLARAVEDLASLEQLFIETLADVGRAGSSAAQAGFADMQRHLQGSGSVFGERLATHVDTLRELLSRRGQESLQAGADMAVKTAEQLGRLAASMLAGIEQGLAGSETGRDGGRRNGPRGDD
jgi:hypothetical protein